MRKTLKTSIACIFDAILVVKFFISDILTTFFEFVWLMAGQNGSLICKT